MPVSRSAASTSTVPLSGWIPRWPQHNTHSATQRSTTFAGMHTALIDKSKTPMCVFQSRYTPASFSQVIGSGGPNVAFATQKATDAAIARQLDLQAARTVNGLLSPNADLTGSFVTNSGRCHGDYQPFTG